LAFREKNTHQVGSIRNSINAERQLTGRKSGGYPCSVSSAVNRSKKGATELRLREQPRNHHGDAILLFSAGELLDRPNNGLK